MLAAAIVATQYSYGAHRRGLAATAHNTSQCDSARPACSRCVRASVPCVYMSDDAEATPTMALKSERENLRRRLQEQVDIVDSIRNLPENEAMDVFRRLRSTDKATAALSSHQGQAGGSSYVSDQGLAQMGMPSAESGIELELTMLHPTAYPVFVPSSPWSIAPASLVGGSEQPTPSDNTPTPPPERDPYCDPRLGDLTVKYWTRIQIADELAARAISHYLTTDHPILGLFDASLFLQDLLDHALDYCSSFLFHAVMALACVRYRHSNIQLSQLTSLAILHSGGAEHSTLLRSVSRGIAQTMACRTLDRFHHNPCSTQLPFGGYQLGRQERARKSPVGGRCSCYVYQNAIARRCAYRCVH